VIVRTAVQLRDAARAAADRYGQAVKRADETIGRDHGHGYYPRADELPDLADRARQAQQRADAADARVDRLIGDPALASQPDPSGFLASAHNRWAVARDAALTAAAQRARLADATRIVTPDRFHRDQFDPPATVEHGPSMGR
jgi:class 3 adenylate cyclase